MKTVAITGGTGFVGSHLTDRLAARGHDVVVVSRSASPETRGDGSDAERSIGGGPNDGGTAGSVRYRAASVVDVDGLEAAFEGVDVVVHLAGIDLERGAQTFQAVHTEGTRNVARAAERDDVETVVFSSYLRARPDCGSAYHETKWAAEEILRDADVEHTICKVGITYGSGDHMLTHLSRALATVPVFATMGRRERFICPLAVEDLVDVFEAAVTTDRLAGATVPVTGAEAVSLRTAVRRVGAVIGHRPVIVPFPVLGQQALAHVQALLMTTPVVAPTQIQMLAEGACEAAPRSVCDPLPEDLTPTRGFSESEVAGHVGEPRPYGIGDLRL